MAANIMALFQIKYNLNFNAKKSEILNANKEEEIRGVI